MFLEFYRHFALITLNNTPVINKDSLYLRHHHDYRSLLLAISPYNHFRYMLSFFFLFLFNIPIDTSQKNALDTIERIISVPFLGTAFIAIRRKFERIKRE